MFLRSSRVQLQSCAFTRLLTLLAKVGILSCGLIYTLPQTLLLERILVYRRVGPCYKLNSTNKLDPILSPLTILNECEKSLHNQPWLANISLKGGGKMCLA